MGVTEELCKSETGLMVKTLIIGSTTMLGTPVEEDDVRDTQGVPMKRYILPTLDWSSLLPIIVLAAQRGASIETDTEVMAELVRLALDDAGRSDMHLVLRTSVPGQAPQAA